MIGSMDLLDFLPSMSAWSYVGAYLFIALIIFMLRFGYVCYNRLHPNDDLGEAFLYGIGWGLIIIAFLCAVILGCILIVFFLIFAVCDYFVIRHVVNLISKFKREK